MSSLEFNAGGQRETFHHEVGRPPRRGPSLSASGGPSSKLKGGRAQSGLGPVHSSRRMSYQPELISSQDWAAVAGVAGSLRGRS